MPIALLLQGALLPLAGARPVLDRWQAMLRLEALLVARARSAFVVQWFGPRMTHNAGRLLVSIENIEALTQQYRQARAASLAGATGPNLAEPLAGLAGMGVGVFISPSGAVLTLYANLRRTLCTVGSVLLTITHSTPMIVLMTMGGGALALVLLPVALLLGIGAAAGAAAGTGESAQTYEMLGDLTRLLLAFRRFIDLLTGPRAAVRNPLLAALLGLVDALAALLAQVVGAAALLLTRVLPQLGPNLRQFAALRDLGVAAMRLVLAIVQEAWAALLALFSSPEAEQVTPWQALLTLFTHVQALVDRIVEGATLSLQRLAALLHQAMKRTSQRTEDHLTKSTTRAQALIADMPLARTLRAMVAMVSAVTVIIGNAPAAAAPPLPPAAPPSAASALARGTLAAVPVLVDAFVGAPPPRPSMAAAATAVARTRGSLPAGGGAWGAGISADAAAVFELSPATQQMAQDLLARPPSVFAGERAALRRELDGHTPEQALAALRAHEEPYRALLAGVVERVLPPHLLAYLPLLRDTFDAIDQHVYGLPAAQHAQEPPVRLLPEAGPLRLHVHRLVLRLPGGDGSSLQAMAGDLRTLLLKQDYRLPATL